MLAIAFALLATITTTLAIVQVRSERLTARAASLMFDASLGKSLVAFVIFVALPASSLGLWSLAIGTAFAG